MTKTSKTFFILATFILASLRLIASDMPKLDGNVYYVNNHSELSWVSEQSNNGNTFEGYTIVLNNDIDLEGVDNDVRTTSANPQIWTPIQNFNGTFDGNGYSIKRLYINNSRLNSVGLFSEIGKNGVVKNLAIASGKIAIDEKDNIGAIAGINNGTISHCINNASIYMGRNVIGGLVGINNGTIEYSYNSGIILQAKDTVGGIAGINSGNITSVYNIGYIAIISTFGSIVGFSETKTTYNNVYFDKQISSQQGGVGNKIETLHGIDRTNLMFEIFMEDNEWITSDSLYPQLSLFANKDISKVTVSPVFSDERYVGITKNFEVSIKDSIKWYSNDASSIKISNIQAIVLKDCNAKDVILLASKNKEIKRVYLNVEGYKIFNPGSLYGEVTICGGKKAKVADIRYGTLASGGKDDDMKNYPYIYSLDIYKVNEDASETFIEHWEGNSQEFSNYVCKDDEVGTFRYYRKAHDSYCYTDWSVTPGYFTLNVARDFTVGQIDTITSDLCSLSDSITIESLEDPQFGGEEFSYRWYYNYYRIDFETGTVLSQMKDQRLPDTWGTTNKPEITVQLPWAGKYEIYRKVADNECSPTSFDRSFGTRTIIAYNNLDAGEIFSLNKAYCLVYDIPEELNSRSSANGGNYKYEYRWLMDDEVIPNSSSVDLSLKEHNITFVAGTTHTFKREVRDSVECERNWTLSKGEVTITLANAVSAGSIKSDSISKCYDYQEKNNINVIASAIENGQGVGTFYYRWVMEMVLGSDTLNNIIDGQNNASLNYTIKSSLFSGINLPVELIFTREVANEYCPEDWMKSEGCVKVRINKVNRYHESVIACPNDFPVSIKHTIDGITKEGQIKTENDSCVLVFNDEFGCKEVVTYNVIMNEAPVVEVDEELNICTTNRTFTVPYVIKSGNPTFYTIDFNRNAKNDGFKAKSGSLSNNDNIELELPESVNSSNMEMYITFFEKEGSCSSKFDTVKMSFSIDGLMMRKYDDVVFVNNGPDNAVHFETFQWYKDGEKIDGAINQYFYDYGGLEGSYYCVMTDEKGNKYTTCEYEHENIERASNTENSNLKMFYKKNKIIVECSTKTTIIIYDSYGNLINSSIIESNYEIDLNANIGVYVVVAKTDDGQQKSIKILL